MWRCSWNIIKTMWKTFLLVVLSVTLFLIGTQEAVGKIHRWWHIFMSNKYLFTGIINKIVSWCPHCSLHLTFETTCVNSSFNIHHSQFPRALLKSPYRNIDLDLYQLSCRRYSHYLLINVQLSIISHRVYTGVKWQLIVCSFNQINDSVAVCFEKWLTRILKKEDSQVLRANYHISLLRDKCRNTLKLPFYGTSVAGFKLWCISFRFEFRTT